MPMLSWFRKLSHRRPSRNELLNEGLDLAMNWGEDWLAPITRRLGERYPQVDKSELDELDVTCRHVLAFALETAHTMLHGRPGQPEQETFGLAIKARYPWVTEENLARMLSQGLYYAAKMGGHGRVA